MPLIEVDMEQARELTPVGDGVYECVINKEPEFFKASDKAKHPGSPNMKWEMTVADIEGQEEQKGAKLFRNTPLTGEGAGITLQMLDALKVAYEKETIFDESSGKERIRTIRFNTSDCLGGRLLVTVKQKEYEGRLTSNVTKVSQLV